MIFIPCTIATTHSTISTGVHTPVHQSTHLSYALKTSRNGFIAGAVNPEYATGVLSFMLDEVVHYKLHRAHSNTSSDKLRHKRAHSAM